MSEIRYAPLGEAVREMRKKNGLRQEDLALYAGVSAKFIHDLEKGEKPLRTDKVEAVLRIFSCRLGAVPYIEEANEQE